MQDKFEIWIARFNEEPMDLNGGLYRLSHEELADEYQYKGNYWHSDGPATWMAMRIFSLARRKYPKLTEKEQLIVAGHALRIDWKELVKGIQWHTSQTTHTTPA